MFAGVFFALALGRAAWAAERPCGVQKVAELPVTMVGTQPTVSAKINGQDVTFVADSGAFYSTLSNSIARELNLRLEAPGAHFHVFGVGGEADIMLTKVKTFTIAGATVPNIDFIVTTGAGGAGFAGYLGQNIWGIADVEYDLGGGSIRLWSPHDCGNAALAYWAGDKPFDVVPIVYAEERSKKVFADAYVNGQRLRVIFDTGASTSVMTMAAAARVGLKPDGPNVRRAGNSGGLGVRALRNWIGPVSSFKIGDEEIRNTQLRFGELEILNADMLLGADFFLSHRVYVAHSQRRLYFTYNGGPVFNLDANRPVSAPAGASPAPGPAGTPTNGSAAAEEPKTADAYSRRGAVLAGRRDYDGAVADFTRAIELDPTNATYRYQRATARLALKQAAPARDDLQEALKLNPAYVDALLARAAVRIVDKDRSGAEADLDRAAELVSRTADVRLQIAGLYATLDRLDRALAQYDLWIAAHDNDRDLSRALAGRCRVRMLARLEPDRALGDCNRAIRMGPPTAAMYESRAVLELRAGDLDRAIEDFNRVLTADPKFALGFYARGVARVRKGQAAEGEADIKAATALNPRVEENARRLGIAGPSAGEGAPAVEVH